MSTDLNPPVGSDPTPVVVDEPVPPVEPPAPAEPADPDTVEVRRDGPILGVVALLAGLMAVAFLLRATGSGRFVDWLLFLAVGAIAAVYLAAVGDARLPLLVIDRHGVRVRRGADWQGIAWPDVDRVEHQPRTGLLRDGRLAVHEADTGRVLVVRLSLVTRLIGADWDELTGALDDLSAGRTRIDEVASVAAPSGSDVEPASDPETDAAASAESEPELYDLHSEVESDWGRPDESAPIDRPDDEPDAEPDDEPDDEPEAQTDDEAGGPSVPSEPEEAVPGRAVADGHRSDVVLAPRTPSGPATDITISGLTEVIELHRLDDEADNTAERAAVRSEPRPDPVVGPPLAAARERIGLSVDALAERTRIRPHVIEAMEVDDFGPCGGDFYARGHLRTLARVLGLDAEPLLAAYDEHYADAPIDARRIFETELATAADGPIRGMRGGLNWSVLVAAVMALVLAWSVARLVMDHPAPVSDKPILAPQGKAALTSKATAVPVVLTAASGGAKVIVRDGAGKVIFNDQIPFMGTVDLDAAPPVRISSSDGGLDVSLDGHDKGAIGKVGRRAEQTFIP